MYCKKCGTNIPEGSDFCPSCGSPVSPEVEKEAPAQNPVQTSPVNSTSTGTEAAVQTKKKPQIKPVYLLAAVAVIVVLVVVFVLNSSVTVDMNKYVNIEFSGYDSLGTATATFDYDSFLEDYEDRIELTGEWEENDTLTLASYLYSSPAEILCEEIMHGSLDQSSGLSNGDTVTYVWRMSSLTQEEVETYFNVKLKYSDKTETVSNLEAVTEVDAFAGVDVQFDGTNSYGTATLVFDNALLDESAYSIDITSGLSNGDSVTVTISDSAAEELATSEGKVPESKTMTKTVTDLADVETVDAFEGVTVTFSGTAPNASAELVVSDDALLSRYDYTLDKDSGLDIGDVLTITIDETAASELPETMGKEAESLTMTVTLTAEDVSHYATEISEITDDALTMMQSQAEDVFTSYRATQWDSETQTLMSFDYIGCYLLVQKEYDAWDDQNKIFLIYKVQIDQNGSEVTLYWFIEFDNALVLEDGSISMNYGQYDEMSRWDSYYEFMDETGKTKKYIGYKELDSFVYDYVETNRDEYTYETTVHE